MSLALTLAPRCRFLDSLMGQVTLVMAHVRLLVPSPGGSFCANEFASGVCCTLGCPCLTAAQGQPDLVLSGAGHDVLKVTFQKLLTPFSSVAALKYADRVELAWLCSQCDGARSAVMSCCHAFMRQQKHGFHHMGSVDHNFAKHTTDRLQLSLQERQA